MIVTIAWIGERSKNDALNDVFRDYGARTQAFTPLELTLFKNASLLFESIARQKSRIPAILVLLDSRGKQLSSEDLAAWIGRQRDEGQQRIVFAIGPADGWTEEDRRRAHLLLSFGPMTLPHELARVVLSEQVYRAFTILAGHPYHSGH